MSDPGKGGASASRFDRIRSRVAGAGADCILVSHLPDIRWACGFTGSSGLLLVLEESCRLITDGRYTHQAAMEVRGAEVVIAKTELLGELDRFSVGRLCFQSDHVTTDLHSRLLDVWPNVELIPVTHFFDDLRAAKSADEIANIRKALRITEAVLEEIHCLIRVGMTEGELAAEIDYRQRVSGAERTAFETIVAYGENSALPHARPTDRKLTSDENILVDTGCVVNGYASDITRNYFIGTPSDEYVNVFRAVDSARERAVENARAGLPANDLDTIARSSIDNAGYGKYFTHSLGHGVGLEVHEYPRIAQSSDAALPNQAVVTVEPGIYLPGKFGVRIEDLILLEENTATPLNKLPTELIVV
ncbi:MAG: aminopeptidase P family protein [Rhodothermia bacterium]|nr:MAG: aminopeptidase P family protein [Rhodothermia bacterium]